MLGFYKECCGINHNIDDKPIDRFGKTLHGHVFRESNAYLFSHSNIEKRTRAPYDHLHEVVFVIQQKNIGMMASGETVLPAKGMGAIPAQLAAKLPASSIRYGTRVSSVTERAVALEDGTALRGRAVVVATEGPEAVRLPPRLAPVQSRKAMTIYFAIDGPPPIADPMVVLNGNLQLPIQSCCVPSVVCPSYAPAGKQLLSVNLFGQPQQEDSVVIALVRGELARWFGPEAKQWKFLRLYRIDHAHPVLTPPSLRELPVHPDNNVFVCGDHRFFPSIQAALENGRHAGEAVAEYVS